MTRYANEMESHMFPSRWFENSVGQSRTARLAAAAIVAIGLQSIAHAQSAPDDYYSARTVRAVRQPADDRSTQGFQPPRREGDPEIRERSESNRSRDARPDRDDREPGRDMRDRGPRPDGPVGQRGEMQRRMDNLPPEQSERIRERMEQFRDRMQDMRERFNDRSPPHGRPMPREQFRGHDDRRPMNVGPGNRRMEDRREFSRDFGPQRSGPRPGPRPDMQMRGGPERGIPPHGRPLPEGSRGANQSPEHRFGPHRDDGPRGRAMPGGPMHREQPQHRGGPDQRKGRDNDQGPEHRSGAMHHERDKEHSRKHGKNSHNDQDRAPQHEMRRGHQNHDQHGPSRGGPDRRNDDRRDRESNRRPMPPHGADHNTPQNERPNDAA